MHALSNYTWRILDKFLKSTGLNPSTINDDDDDDDESADMNEDHLNYSKHRKTYLGLANQWGRVPICPPLEKYSLSDTGCFRRYGWAYPVQNSL
jgi:hypothetical protein